MSESRPIITKRGWRENTKRDHWASPCGKGSRALLTSSSASTWREAAFLRRRQSGAPAWRSHASAQWAARAKVPHADALASMSPSASAEYKPRGRAASVETQTSKVQHSRLPQHGGAGSHATKGRGRHHAHQGGHQRRATRPRSAARSRLPAAKAFGRSRRDRLHPRGKRPPPCGKGSREPQRNGPVRAPNRRRGRRSRMRTW